MRDEYSLEKLERVREFERIKDKYKRKNYKDAKRELVLFTLKYPDDDFGWYYYGKILFQEGKYDEALNVFLERDYSYNFMMKIDIIKCYLELLRYEDAYLLICELIDIVDNDFTPIGSKEQQMLFTSTLRSLKNMIHSMLSSFLVTRFVNRIITTSYSSIKQKALNSQ